MPSDASSPRLSALLVALAVLGCLARPAPTHAQSSLAGTYKASPQRIEAQVSTWGEDCGPKPTNIVLNEQPTVVVEQVGNHLSLRFPDRTLRTDACWSPNPAVKVVSSTASSARFQAECRTPTSDAKRERGRYTVTVGKGKLELLEESDYDWQLKESHCVAKVRILQTLTSTDQAAPPPPQTATEQPAAREAACLAGTPTRLRVRPAEARIAPGERVCFNVRALDAAGCAASLPDSAFSFQLSRPAGAEGTLQGACFKAAANAALAEGVFRIAVSGAGLRADSSVTVAAPDLSDITARRGSSSSGALNQGPSSDETVLESSIRAVASGSHGMLWLGLMVAALAAVLSMLAILALRMVRRQAQTAQRASMARPSMQERAAPSAADASFAAQTPAPAVPMELTGPQRICPKCRRGYAPGTERCSADGEPLLDYGDFLKRTEQATMKHCPECGEKLASDAVFCGRCGHKVAQ